MYWGNKQNRKKSYTNVILLGKFNFGQEKVPIFELFAGGE